jgi:hypothetical protein
MGLNLGLPEWSALNVMLYSNLAERQAKGALRTLAAAIRSTVSIR